MKTIAAVIAVAVVLVILIIVNAPPPDSDIVDGGQPVPSNVIFTILEAEHDAVRQIWAEDIVGAGQEHGLKFHEDWRDEGFDAGPLPALFLRETAEGLRRNPVPLYLFLGSDFPINDANKLSGIQSEYFELIKRTGYPQFFLDEETGFDTAMFSDIATTETCVVCHNSDPDSPKTDWKVGDIMGATTWAYPEGDVGVGDALIMVQALRGSVREAYERYLEKVATFSQPPPVGGRWPSEGYFLPSADVFMREAEARASAATLRALMAEQQASEVE